MMRNNEKRTMPSLKLPKILINSFIYTFFNVIQKAISFFLLPLYTTYLTPDDYGIVNVLTSTTALLTFLYTFSIQAASSRFHYKYNRNMKLVKKIWGANFIFLLLNSFVWVIITICTYNYILIYLIGDDISFMPCVLICLINGSLSPIFLYYQIYLQTSQKAKLFAINNFLYFVLALILNIVLVVFFEMKALGILCSMLTTTIVFSIYAFFYLRKEICLTLSWKIVKRSLQYSIPLIPHSLSGWLDGMLDRIFINRIINLASVGLYSISYQFGMVINMLGFGINQAYTPWFFKNHDSVEGRRKIVDVSDLAIAGLIFIGFFVALFSQEILVLMTAEKYHSVWPTIIILVFANLFDCLYYFYVAVLFLDKTKVLSCISISCSIINCVINYFLISHYGYIGAAFSFLFVQAVKSIIVYYFAKRTRSDIAFHGKKHYLELFIPLVCIFPIIYIQTESFAFNILLKIIVSIIFLIIVCLLNVKIIKLIVYGNKNKTNN